MNQIENTFLGTLKQDENYKETWHSNPIKIPFLNDQLPVILEFDPNEDIEFINELELRLKELFDDLRDYAMSAGDWLKSEHQKVIDSKEVDRVWSLISPYNITVWRDNSKRIRMDFHCSAWDEEHGLEIEFLEGKKITGTLVSIFNDKILDLTE